LKPEQWGSPLVQEKYQEEKACDKRHPYRIIIIIIVTVRHNISALRCHAVSYSGDILYATQTTQFPPGNLERPSASTNHMHKELQYCCQQRQSEQLRLFTKRMSRDHTGRLFNFHVSFFQQASEESIMRQVYEKLILPNRHDASPDTVSGLQRVCDQSKYAFVVDSMRAFSVSNSVTCDLVAVPDAFIPASATFLIAKHSPFRRLINSKYDCDEPRYMPTRRFSPYRAVNTLCLGYK